MAQGNLFNQTNYGYESNKNIAKENRIDSYISINKGAVKTKIKKFAIQAVKPFHAFELSMITGFTLLSIRPRLTEMVRDKELKIVGKIKTQYSKTHICLYEKN